MRHSLAPIAAAFGALVVGFTPLPGPAQELLYATEGNRLHRFDVDTIANPKLLQDVFVEAASPGEQGGPGPTGTTGRDMNGMICPIPGSGGGFVNGEDTGQPSPRPGWGVFDADANQIGKLTTTYLVDPDDRVGEPFGCAFDSHGNLFTTAVGEPDFGASTGQLILWFPPFDHFPGAPGTYPNEEISTNFCKIAVDLGTASGIAIDDQDNVYVAAPASFQVVKFSPPFPTGPDAAGGCGRLDPTGQPLADLAKVNRSVFVQGPFLATFTGLAMAPNGNLYLAQVLPGVIDEYTLGGAFVRNILTPPGAPALTTGTPQGIAVGQDGSLYYADLNIGGNLQPGDDGKFWRIRFDAKNNPLPPEKILDGLDFPDGVGLFSGDFQVDPQREWRTYAGGPERHFYHAEESILTPQNIGLLRERWRFDTGAVVTGSPAVAVVDLPGEGPTQVVYFQSWDGFVYALRLGDGSLVWSFETDLQPGASFPNAASAHVEQVDGVDRVFIGAGEILYSLDAVSGAEVWRFVAGTGCEDANGDPPGSCGFGQAGVPIELSEQNQIESSGIVADGKIFFGMDVNDAPLGKGGFYAVDVVDGTLAWYFDPQTGATCTPLAGDDIRKFDGYHSEAELGLPAGFRARAGCDFPFDRYGCSNIWSSPALDVARGALFVASSNCDTDDDPTTNEPPPPMPPFDEAIFSLGVDGNVRWRWRPREVDNADLAFGAVPNLFDVQMDGASYDVVGVGCKDGTYYVIDRDGVNQDSGVAWNDADPSGLPYWATNVVAGGALGGVIATAAADTERRRIYFGTAPGGNNNVLSPQLPTMHALDMDSGAVVWDNGTVAGPDASFSPASSVPGLVFTGSVLSSQLRGFQTQDDGGQLLLHTPRLLLPGLGFGDAVASGAVVVNGTLMVGVGVGFRGPAPGDPGEVVSRIPSPLVALCVPGQPGCSIPIWQLSDLDLDDDVDQADQDLFLATLGTAKGDPGFLDLADLDRDGLVTFVDYQLWLDGKRRFDLLQMMAACGLLGVEPLLVVAGVFGVRRRRSRRMRRQ